MLFKSQVFTQVSGSVGGLTFSHNRGGLYTRSRTVPVNPNSTFQVQVRAGMTTAVTSWLTLTQAERDAWDLYAANVPTTNKLGDTVFLTGQNWFIASTVVIEQINVKLTRTLPALTGGPTIFDRGEFTTPISVVDDALGVSVAFTNTDAWANEDEAALMIFEGQPQNPSRKFFNGPWRLIESIEGDSVTAPVSPEIIGAVDIAARGFTTTPGQGVTIAYAVIRADGRLSTRRNDGPIIVT